MINFKNEINVIGPVRLREEYHRVNTGMKHRINHDKLGLL